MTLDTPQGESRALTLAPTVGDDELRQALIRALGLDKVGPAQQELALAIASQYGLDPMLRHLVLVEGKPYITRDGLLHVAHKSGDFDGIEVDQPRLDEDGKYWRTWATVYRKSFSRPFRYPGRYPATSGNTRYNEEMCIKVAEVMTLRRAFDVAAPVIEERWDGDLETTPDTAPPATLADKIAARAATLEAAIATDDPGGPVAEGIGTVLAEMEAAGEIVILDPEPADATEAPDEGGATSATPPEPAPVEAPTDPEPTGRVVVDTTSPAVPEGEPLAATVAMGGPTLQEFGALVAEMDPARVKRVAKGLFPTISKFGDLGPTQLQSILDALEQNEPEAAPAPKPTGKVEQCGHPSPYDEDKSCTLDKGHKGVHRAGVSTSW